MPTIQFQDANNTKINFSGNPSPDDIEEAYNNVSGGNQSSQSQQSEQSTQTSQDNQPPQQDNSNDLEQGLSQESQLYNGGQQQNPNSLNFGDHAKMSFMDSQGQEDYLKSKYKYVENDGKGNLSYGDTPDSMQPVNAPGMFNDFVSKLGNMVSSIPAIAGQVALTAGAPEVGLPMLAGRAAAGAAGGQLLSGLIGSKMQNRVDPEKIATDAVISGAFGAAGTAAGEALSGTSKMIAKKAGIALDNYRKGLILGGKNTNQFDASIATVLHMVTGLDKKTLTTGQTLGWKNILDSEEASDPHGIASVAGDVSNDAANKEVELGKNVDTATESLIKDTNDKSLDSSGNLIKGDGKVINTAPVQSRLLDDLTDAGILNKNESMASNYGIDMSRATSSGAINKNPTYSINPNSPLNTKFFQKFLGQLGVKSRNGIFQMAPDNSGTLISVADALKTKQSFQAIVNEGKSITPMEANIAKRALYGNIEEGVSGLSDQLSKIATKVNNTTYSDANGNFSKFLNLKSTLKKAGMDVDNPFNSQSYLTHINNATPLTTPLLQQLDKTLGNNFMQRAQAWGVNQKIKNISPNFLRLGMVASLFGAGILDPDAGGKGGKILLAGLLGTPTGMKILLKGAGGGYGSMLSGMGEAATKTAGMTSNKSAQAILSQLIKNKTIGQ